MPDIQDVPAASDAGAALAVPAPGPLAAESVPGTGTAAGQGLVALAPAGPPPLTAVQLALSTGWTMAVLYGHIQAPPPGGVPALPTAHELQPADRRELEFSRLGHLLHQLSFLPGLTDLPGIAQSALAIVGPADFADGSALRPRLTTVHLAILKALTAGPPEIQLAYELGRSLRDSVSPPLATSQDPAGPALARQFARDRIARLQEWLAILSTQFPQHTAAVVATSLGRWSELVAATAGPASARLSKGDGRAVAAQMCEYLLPQGDSWLQLLTGARPAAGLLSPEGYVAAGEVALSRSAAIVRRVLRHYWPALLVVAAALAGTLYLTVSALSGAAEVWTSIAAITGSLGISANAIASSTSRLAAEAATPVFAMSEEDAMAWAVTAMPPVSLSYRGVQRLRSAGIAPPGSLGRV